MRNSNVGRLGCGNEAAGLIYSNYGDFKSRQYPEREFALAPWLPIKSLAMIAGYRGTGKTYLGLAIAFAIATGGEVLGWEAEKPRKVLYIDGEMAQEDLQERLKAIEAYAINNRIGNPDLVSENLFMVCGEDQRDGNGMPDLAGDDARGRHMVEKVLEATGAEVLMLDNLSCLFRNTGDSENVAESWKGTQAWLVSLKQKGKAVVFFHHTGKPDDKGHTKQRGTSAREDALNTSILLQPVKHKFGCFMVEWSKSRGFIPDGDGFYVNILDKKGECHLEVPNRGFVIRERLAAGETQEEIAKDLGVSQTTIHRWAKE